MDNAGRQWGNENLPCCCFMKKSGFDMIKKIREFLVTFLGGILLSSVQGAFPVWAETTPKIKIVASFSVLGDLVRQVGGDLVEVDIIVPENADPHVYQPKPLDAKKLNQAELVIVNGLGFEGWFDRLIANSGFKGQTVVAAKDVKPRVLLDSQAGNVADPHAWHDVKNVILYVTEIKTALQQKRPDHREQLEKAAEKYIESLYDLDRWVHDQFTQITPAQRKVITTHDAFAYYGTAYHIEFLSPVGISTDAEPSAAKVADLIKTIKEQNIRAVFIENLSSRKLIEQIAKEAQTDVDGVLYADSLSDPADKNAPAKTYVDMVRHNTLSIRKALNS